MIENLKRILDSLIGNIESRSKSERGLILGMALAALVLSYLYLAFDPVRNDITRIRGQIAQVQGQIAAQQTAYAAMVEASQEDPNKFANDRLVVVSREQELLDQEIETMAGDLVTPNQMTQILTSVLARQNGLDLLFFENRDAQP